MVVFKFRYLKWNRFRLGVRRTADSAFTIKFEPKIKLQHFPTLVWNVSKGIAVA